MLYIILLFSFKGVKVNFFDYIYLIVNLYNKLYKSGMLRQNTKVLIEFQTLFLSEMFSF